MAIDLWEQLARDEPPAPPPSFDRQVHERLNKNLVLMHLLDLGLKGAGYALVHFAQALIYLLELTITGRGEVPKPRRTERPNNP